MTPVLIQPANGTDAARISGLIASVAHYFTEHPQGVGAEGFLISMSEQAIASYIADPCFHCLVALDGETLAGVAALRSDNHLFHLFVAPSMHRQGVATQLWQAMQAYAQQQGRGGEFTVNATPYAKPFYERMGFVVSGERVVTRGVSFTPMRKAPQPQTVSTPV